MEGIITSPGGERINPITFKREFHNGVDIACEIGTSVIAPREGTVLEAGLSESFGYYIKIACDEYVMVFGHLNKLLTKANETVTQGQTIALSGNTGRSTGPHLHYGLFLDGQYINPLQYLTLPFTEEARLAYANSQ